MRLKISSEDLEVCFHIKMATTIEKLNIKDIKFQEPFFVQNKSYKYLSIPIDMDCLRLDGKMKIYRHSEHSYSIGIDLLDNQVKILNGVESKLKKHLAESKSDLEELEKLKGGKVKFARYYEEELKIVKLFQTKGENSKTLQKLYAKLYASLF